MAEKSSPQEITVEAQRLYQSAEYLAAAELFAKAADGYADQGDALASAELKNNQSVALLRAKQPQAALDATKGTEAVFAASNDFRRQGIALANQASALEALKRKKEAIPCYRQAAEALELAGEGELRADVMQLLAFHYLRRFKLYDAVITLQSGLAGVKNPTPKQRLMKKFLFIRL